MFKYRSIVNSLKQEIASGRWQPGDAFPGVREVCARFHVSHLTAVKALKTPVRHITIATTLVARASTQRPTGNAHTAVGRTERGDGE